MGTTREESHPLAPDDPSDAELTRRFHCHLPQLIPPHFEISPLPNEVLFFAILVLQTAESSWIRAKKAPTNNEGTFGAAGSASATKQESLTPSWVVYQSQNKNSSFVPSSGSTEWLTGLSQADFVDNTRNPWWRRLCTLPQAT